MEIDHETRGKNGRSLDLSALPEGCVAAVVSLTSPHDAGRLSLVSTIFKSAAESDAVWERFLPLDYKALVPPSLCYDSKKQLYLNLCDRPILIDQGRKSLSLDKWSGKKCYMLSARELRIVWGDTPSYWRWISVPESRFAEVAELLHVCWLEIRGRISISLLSTMTHYKAYLVYQTTPTAYGLDNHHLAEAAVALAGTEGNKHNVYLDPEGERRWLYHNASEWPPEERGERHPKERKDGWKEIELGEFFNDGSQDGELEMSVLEVRGGNWKSGLIIQGMEIRPRRW